MSAPDHCTHCWAGGDSCHISLRDHSSAHSDWNDGHCPACGEAEHLAAEADRLAAMHHRVHEARSDPTSDAVGDAYAHMADIARGRGAA